MILTDNKKSFGNEALFVLIYMQKLSYAERKDTTTGKAICR